MRDILGEVLEELRQTREQLAELERWVDCLNESGVGSWDGYEYAQELMEE